MRTLLFFVAHPGVRTWCHALPWWAVCCWLSSRTAAASKQKYLDYDVFPPMESNHRKAVPGAGWVGVIIQAVYNMCIMLPVKNINP